MTLLNPALLAGLLAIGLPILIHMLSKPRLKRIKWAANRFLLKIMQKNRKRAQAEDVLLLLLRCLLVALAVLLFTRPALLVPFSGLQTGQAKTIAVIVMDATASMGQSDGVRIRFDQAKSMVDDILSKLGPGSSCALYLATSRAQAVIAQPTEDFAVLRHTLDKLEPTDEGGDLFPATSAAMDLLKSLGGKNREIFVLTDSQKAAWTQLGRLRQLQSLNQKDIPIHFVIVGDHGENNVAVSGLDLSGNVAVTDQPLRYSVQVSNWGKAAVERLSVKLAVDTDAPQDEGVVDRIEPGGTKSISLFARFRTPGTHAVTATIPGDHLPSDNHLSSAVVVLDQIKTLVVEGSNNADPTLRDGFFLRHALTPVRPEQLPTYYVKVTMGRPNGLESATLNQYQVIFLSNIAQLTPHAAQSVSQYVNQGGTLVVFPGPETDTNFYDSDATFSALLPAKLQPVRDVPGDQKFLAWQSHGYDHPITALWNQPEAGNLGSVRVSRYFPLTAGPARAQLVVKYVNGEPAVMEKSVGKGKVILFSSTATTAWTTLPLHPSFVPLLSRIMAFATSTLGGSLNVAAGEPFAYNVDPANAGKDLSVTAPGEKKRRVIGSVERGEEFAVLRDSDTSMAGPYQLFVGEESKPKVIFAVQGDPTESNLQQEPKADIESLLNPPAAQSEEETPEKVAASKRLVPGWEFWTPLALALLVLVLMETALSHRFSQAK